MAIRKATYKETQEILNHALDALKESTVGHVEPSWEKAHQMVSPFLKHGGYYLVYTENNEIQGWAGIGISYDIYTDSMVGFIQELYVLPAHRNQGVAKKLCEEAIRQLIQKGYKKVQLNVFAGNSAKRLYQKLGFNEVFTLMERDY